MIDRINKIKEEKAKSEREFANMIGISQRAMNSYINSDRKVSLDCVLKILDRFPDISSDWLLFGKGEMHFVDNLPKYTGMESESELDMDVSLAKARVEVEGLRGQLLMLKERIEELQDLVRFQREKIRELEGYGKAKRGA